MGFRLPRIRIKIKKDKENKFVDLTPYFTMEEKFPQVINKVKELVEIEKKKQDEIN